MVNITKDGNSIKFTFTDSIYYLFGNGVIEAPVNSLSLVVDESDMVTFKKASSNDVFVSIPISETNFSTKADLITFYKENMVGSGGGDPNAFVDAEFDSETYRINFYNSAQELVDYIDASSFIFTGMIDDVKVENGYLVIDFNTASGQQDIYIPLTSIFPADDYYTKTDIENILNPKEQAIAEALTELHETKADKTEIPTVPTNVSSFNNDAGYITTSVNDLANYYDKNYIDTTVGDINTILQSI